MCTITDESIVIEELGWAAGEGCWMAVGRVELACGAVRWVARRNPRSAGGTAASGPATWALAIPGCDPENPGEAERDLLGQTEVVTSALESLFAVGVGRAAGVSCSVRPDSTTQVFVGWPGAVTTAERKGVA